MEDQCYKLCKLRDVVENCPVSCGECCEDLSDYNFRGDSEMVGCDWLYNFRGDSEMVGCDWLVTVTPADYCNKWINGRMVRDGCPNSCNFCGSPVFL